MQMLARKVSAEKIYPSMGFFKEEVRGSNGKARTYWVNIHKRGPITIGWEVSYPVAHTANEAAYDNIVTQFSLAARNLPEWCVMHKQDWYEYDTYKAAPAQEFLDRSYEAHFEGRRYLTHRSYLFLTLATEHLVMKKGKASGIFGIENCVSAPKLETYEDFMRQASEFIDTLCSSGLISARALTYEDWQGTDTTTGIIQKYMMLGNDSLYTSDIQFKSDSVSVYDKTARCFVICESDQFQNRSISNTLRIESLSGQSNNIFLSTGAEIGVLLDCEHVVNHIIVNVPRRYLENKLDYKRRIMTSGLSSNDNRLNVVEVEEFLDDMYSGDNIAVLSCLSVVVWDDERAITSTAGKVSTAFSKMNITRKLATWNAPVVWYAGMPSCAFDISEDNLRITEIESELCIGAYETFDKGFPEGTLKICDRMRDVPLLIDTQEYAQKLGYIGNYNIFVLGSSGSGKSFFVNNYLLNLYNRGECVYIIDVGDSYEGLCGVIRQESGGRDGIYYRWDRNSPFSFNAFSGWFGWLDEEGNLRQDEPGVNYIQTVLQMIWIPERGWTTDNLPILRQTIRDFAEELRYTHSGQDGEPIMDDYFRFVSDTVRPQLEQGCYWAGGTNNSTADFDVNKFVRALSTYAKGGAFSFLFNDRHPQDLFNSNFTVFEVKQLSEVDKDGPFYSLCIFSMMNAFDVKMRCDAASLSGRQPFKQMVIEEAWKAIDNEFVSPYLKELWKTARKNRTSAMVVTQQLEDIQSSAIIKDAIIANSDIKVILDQKEYENNTSDLREQVGLNDMDINSILSMNKRGKGVIKEAFIKLGNKFSGCFSNEVSSRMALAFESEYEKKKDMLVNYERCGNMVEAIDTTIRERESRYTAK